MDLRKTYFFTATLLNWYPLLQDNTYKDIITESLSFLVKKRKIVVYGFVIMPNHIHLVWRNIEMNGKEYPDESFLKFTAHVFGNELKKNIVQHERFRVNKADRRYQFWQRGALPIAILSREMLEQKLDYIHLNPLQSHWNLVEDPNDYFYSSCAFYERDQNNFDWLRDYRCDF